MTSRQVQRQAEREALKRAVADKRDADRVAARRARLTRQTEREKSGFYEGTPSVLSALSQSRSRIVKRRVKKGNFAARILLTKTVGGRERQFHATKGWRSYRAL